MGCSSSIDVMSKIKEQEKKIDNLIEINTNLQTRLNEMNTNNQNEARHANDTGDITNLKTTIDLRFNKLEKTVEKIHNEFKVKLFEGIVDNLDDGLENNNRQKSLTLNFDKENPKMGGLESRKEGEPQWNDLLYDSHLTPQRLTLDKLPHYDDHTPKQGNNKKGTKNFVDHNDIQMELANNLGAGNKSKEKLYDLSDPMEEDLLIISLVKVILLEFKTLILFQWQTVLCSSQEGCIHIFKWDYFGSEDSDIRAVSISTNKVLNYVENHSESDEIEPITRLAMSYDMKFVVSQSYDSQSRFKRKAKGNKKQKKQEFFSDM